MASKKRSSRSDIGRIKLEEVLVKEEPDTDDYYNSDEFSSSNNVRNSPNAESPLEEPPKKRKIVRSTRHCHTQVYPDDIDQLELNAKIPTIPGENEPIPAAEGEENIPQCRFCLRRVSQNNLLVIVNKHKAKAAAAFKCKVFINDAYPYACRNCLNLLDIFLDFRQTVQKAKYLLLSGRAHLESDGWDDPVLVETIANCKNAVEQNRKQIDSAYEAKLELEEQMEDSKQEQDTSNVESAQSNEEHTISFEPVEVADAELYDETVEVLVEKIESLDEEDDEDYDDNAYDDDLEDADYKPSVEEESTAEQEPTVVEVKPPTKRGRKPGKLNKSDKEPRIKRPMKPKKSNKANINNKPDNLNNKKGQLCDFCGETVCAQSIEAHRNRHLGIKPYKCPAIGCELTFHSRHNQLLHVRRAHGENGVPSHECNICGHFIRGPLGALKYHQRRHATTEKNYVCQICGKGFTMPWYLTQHSITHSGEFPHKCSYCGKKFNNKWSMKTHEKNIHEKRNDVPMTQMQQDEQPTTSYDQYGSSSF